MKTLFLAIPFLCLANISRAETNFDIGGQISHQNAELRVSSISTNLPGSEEPENEGRNGLFNNTAAFALEGGMSIDELRLGIKLSQSKLHVSPETVYKSSGIEIGGEYTYWQSASFDAYGKLGISINNFEFEASEGVSTSDSAKLIDGVFGLGVNIPVSSTTSIITDLSYSKTIAKDDLTLTGDNFPGLEITLRDVELTKILGTIGLRVSL